LKSANNRELAQRGTDCADQGLLGTRATNHKARDKDLGVSADEGATREIHKMCSNVYGQGDRI